MRLGDEFNINSNPAIEPPVVAPAPPKVQQPVAARGMADTLMDFFSRFLMAYTPALNRLKEQASEWAGGQDTWWGRFFDNSILRKDGFGASYDHVDSVIQEAARRTIRNGGNIASIDQVDADDVGIPLWKANQGREEGRILESQGVSLQSQWATSEQAGGFTDQGVAGNTPLVSTTPETPAPQQAAKPAAPTV